MHTVLCVNLKPSRSCCCFFFLALLAADTDTEDAKQHTIFLSCDRTEEDEQFAVMRFQVLCLLAGAVAFVSVRQQKQSAASLFDQRRLNLQKKRRTSDNPHDVEMTSMLRQQQQQQQQQEETKSLLRTESNVENPLDIV